MRVPKGWIVAIALWAFAAFALIGAYQYADEFLGNIHAGFSTGVDQSFLTFFVVGGALTLIVFTSLVALYLFHLAFLITGTLVMESKYLEGKRSGRVVGKAEGSPQGSPSRLTIVLRIAALVTIILVLANTVALVLILIQEHALGGGGDEFFFRALNKLLEQTVLPLVLVALLAGLVDRLDQLRSGPGPSD